MSGLVRGAKKIFRAVGQVVKKVAAPVLAIAAITFTAGAALGLAPLAGGFGGAVSSALGAIGAPTTGALGSALTGAVTQAGYGAAIGGIGSVATGGKFQDGAAAGALAGAVTGGLTGAMNPAGAGPTQSVTASSKNLGQGLSGQSATAGPATNGPVAQGLGGITAAQPAAPATSTVPAQPSFFDKLGAFANNNPTLTSVVGQGLAGAAQGYLVGKQAQDQQQAEEDQWNRVSDSYSIDGSAYDSSPSPDTTKRPTPRYRYNRDSHRIEYS